MGFVKNARMICAVFDTKPYDREFLTAAAAGSGVELRFLEFRLGPQTTTIAEGAECVCIFVNDKADRPILEALAAQGTKHIALRCAGFNNVDLDAAKELGLTVTRVPAYSPNLETTSSQKPFQTAKYQPTSLEKTNPT